jgi:hypothetical protein
VADRTNRFFWRLSVAIMLLITAADAFLGSRVILIGLLMMGPCCALFSARRVSTAQAGGIAVGLAFLLAFPDGIWATSAQFARCLDGRPRLHLGRWDHRIVYSALSRSSDCRGKLKAQIEARSPWTRSGFTETR